MRTLVFDQSSPVHPLSESRGVDLSVTHEHANKRTEILVSNIVNKSKSNSFLAQTIHYKFLKSDLHGLNCSSTSHFTKGIFNRPGAASAVLQTSLSLINRPGVAGALLQSPL